jgi:hypothetical protein
MIGSMGRVGAAGDNATMESSFSLLQKNVLDRRTWKYPRRTTGRDRDLDREGTYHRRRRQAALDRMTPVEYQLIMTPADTPGGLTPTITVRAADPSHRCSGIAETTWAIYRCMFRGHRAENRAHRRTLMVKLIAGVLALFDRPVTGDGPTEAINGGLDHLRGSAIGFRNLTNDIARALLETGGFRPRLHLRCCEDPD